MESWLGPQTQGWERQGKADSRHQNMSVTYRNQQDAFLSGPPEKACTLPRVKETAECATVRRERHLIALGA